MTREISPEEQTIDISYNYRPLKFEQFIGQKDIIDNLKVFVKATLIRQKPLDHVLIYGPPGLGKTSLANIIANELQVGIKNTSGPALTKAADLAAILTNLSPHDVLFIDEIHRLPASVGEILYPAMEDMHLDIIIGEGPAARTVRIDLPPFTLIGATTRSGLITKPLFDRFGIQLRVDFYDNQSLTEIVLHRCKKINLNISTEAARLIAKSSRGTPRVAGRLLKRISDMGLVNQLIKIELSDAANALQKLGVDENGLDRLDRHYLSLIVNQFHGGPVGVITLAAAMCEQTDLLEDVIEPFLLRLGFIERTPRGRVVLPVAKKLLNSNLKLLL